MRYFTFLLFMALACPMPAEAEPMSVRCDGQYFRDPQPYFMTFDIETNHFVFERAGGNIITGEIISATDDRLDLSLRGTGGRILLSFNRTRNMVTWPGLPAGELGRFEMQHACTGVTGRTMLSTFYQPEPFDPKRRDPVDAFSLTCPGNTGPFFITMDRVTKTVVVEYEHSSGGSSGDITSLKDGVITFNFGRDRTKPTEAVWDEGMRSLTLMAATGDPAKPDKVLECTATKPRSIMEGYKDWARWGK